MYSAYEKTPRKVLVNLLLAILRASSPLGVRQAVNNGLAILIDQFFDVIMLDVCEDKRYAVLMTFLESLIKS
ncbi:MAG TPA: hypothetical protein VJ250_04860 [Nitrososphaeraceae archaeon]|nr:hypothetical protein [Nitrososphaeraceae archaeon]